MYPPSFPTSNQGISASDQLLAGAAAADITPQTGAFLYGYPHKDRISTSVHDPLYASALYLNDGDTSAMFLSADLIWLPRKLIKRVRQRVSAVADIPAGNVMITASHTHSGPVTSAMLSNESDPVVPDPAPDYLTRLEATLENIASQAVEHAQHAQVCFSVADGTGLGTNRRDPNGPSFLQVPVVGLRSVSTGEWIALMVVCAMHPTVLHEDSTVISGDFPGLARLHLWRALARHGLPFMYHMGAGGNQSPRHVTCGNTIDEADRLGALLCDAIVRTLNEARVIEHPSIECLSQHITLPTRIFPDPDESARQLTTAKQRVEQLRHTCACPTTIRTAECDVFGAEEALTLSRAAEDGRLEAAAEACLPAEVQVIRIGPLCLVGWPGEVFVEYALEVMDQFDRVFVITLANGELQGYLVTAKAVEEGGYEASNALFRSPESGRMLVDTTIELLRRIGAAPQVGKA